MIDILKRWSHCYEYYHVAEHTNTYTHHLHKLSNDDGSEWERERQWWWDSSCTRSSSVRVLVGLRGGGGNVVKEV